MRQSVFILFFSFLGAYTFCQTDQKGCSSYKAGEFAYRDSSNTIINVTRKEGKQQEEDKKNKIITKFRIKWTGDCEYVLTQIWSNSKARRKQNRSVVKIVITKANGNDSYEYQCTCRYREDIGNSGTMVRLSD